MSWFSRRRVEGGAGPILRVDRLNVYYGRAHAVQDVSLTLDRGILAVVGRNGMGKTTLCNAITGLVAASGIIKLTGAELVGLPPHAITGLGVGYVPQGRRVWPSLTVDEHRTLETIPVQTLLEVHVRRLNHAESNVGRAGRVFPP